MWGEAPAQPARKDSRKRACENPSPALPGGPRVKLVPALLAALEGARAALPAPRQPFAADALIARAQRTTGHREFGDDGFMEGLRRFLTACAAEARLGVIGRQATKWDTVRF